jgi:RNA polymerase sigma-70 factor (ECF subfamily)
VVLHVLIGLVRAALGADVPDRGPMVDAALAGDPASARKLIALVTPVVRSRAAGALHRRGRRAGRSIDQELEDLTQEVLLCLFENAGKRLRAWSREPGTLEGFVGIVAEREVASIMRSGRRSPWRDDPSSDEEVELRQEPRESDAARIQSREFLERLLDRMRERLSPQGLAMFYALFAEEKSVETVCAEMKMSAEAVYAWRSRLGRLARNLAEEIEKEPARPSEPVGSSRHEDRSMRS